MRGKATFSTKPQPPMGITPAYAGKSNLPRGCRPASQDHPRLCGEKRFCVFLSTSRAGSPPPMRGKGGNDCHQEANARITPAYAGKRQTKQSHSWVCGDHPRLCGEKHVLLLSVPVQSGITPAYAGKSIYFSIMLFFYVGSPPPMRGKVSDTPPPILLIRITPAYAGKS